MKLGIISDIHSKPEPLKQAIKLFEKKQVDRIYNLGDTAGYFDQLDECVQILKSEDISSIIGNHDLWYLALPKTEQTDWITEYFRSLENQITLSDGSQRLLMVHEAPSEMDKKGFKLLDQNNQLIESELKKWEIQLTNFDYDILLVGHSHQVFSERIAKTLVINPGSSIFNNSVAILNINGLEVDFLPLSDGGISRTWNWSLVRSLR
ncbi:MAG: metallophosphoesterase family protein [Calditrichaeota bacterium]|nr:metallophosphoesterase family protein [Calditrichota bacterium]